MSEAKRALRSSALWPLAGLAVVAIVAGGMTLSGDGQDPGAVGADASQPGPDNARLVNGGGALPPSLHDPGTPCSAATMLSLPALPALVGRVSSIGVLDAKSPIILPDPAVAVPTRAWSCSADASAPVVMFGSIQAVYDTTLTAKDHAAYLEALVEGAKESDAPLARLLQINGGSVAQIKGTVESDRSALAMFIGDTFVVLESMRSADMERMPAIASSVLKNG